MAAPQGNRFWEARSKHGRNPLFGSPEQLWDACVEYFEWVENNPLWETKSYQYQGVPVQDQIPKMRAMTISGMCLFIDIDETTWKAYKAKEGFSGICTRAEKIIYNQKFAGAAAEFLNPSIIARDLGLVDKAQIDNTHKWEEVSDTELEARIKALENELKGKTD